MWKTIYNVIPTKKSKRYQKSKVVFDVNEMNNHFIQTPETLVRGFGNTSHFEDMTPLTENVFTLPVVEEKEVNEIINNFDETKAIGSDLISVKHLKRLLVLVPLIVYLISKSFKDLKVPEIWKTAKVKALYKNGGKLC